MIGSCCRSALPAACELPRLRSTLAAQLVSKPVGELSVSFFLGVIVSVHVVETDASFFRQVRRR